MLLNGSRVGYKLYRRFLGSLAEGSGACVSAGEEGPVLTAAQQGVCVVKDSWKNRMGFGNDRTEDQDENQARGMALGTR